MAQHIYIPPTRHELENDLRKMFDDPEPWLHTPNEHLGGKRPTDVIDSGDEGRERVRDLLEAIKLGLPT
jgi:uncharacterized protein (DUF2384 family)